MPSIASHNGIDMADIASINGQDVPSGGTSATTAPTITVTTASTNVTVTVDNHSTEYTNPNYSVISKVGGVTVVADADVNHTLDSGDDHVSNTLTFTDTSSASGQRTVEVRAQDFGEAQSAATTATYTITSLLPSSRYIRIRAVNSDGSNTDKRLWIAEMRFYEGPNQSGTSHPTNMVSATTDTDGNNYYTISAGYSQSGYNPYEAFDDSTSLFDNWWSLGTSSANNWIQVEFDSTQFSTAPTINSFEIQSYNSGTYADYIAVETSDDGTNFTQQEVYDFDDSTSNMQSFP